VISQLSSHFLAFASMAGGPVRRPLEAAENRLYE
jgi:hypothetical protein